MAGLRVFEEFFDGLDDRKDFLADDAKMVEAGGFAPPSEDVRPKACYVA